jgi:4-hydroxy-3-polyprenylbenzoate decarboxylase
MLKLSRMGAVILPPMPAFYNHPASVDDVINHTVSRVLDQFGLETGGTERWTGEMGIGRGANND